MYFWTSIIPNVPYKQIQAFSANFKTFETFKEDLVEYLDRIDVYRLREITFDLVDFIPSKLID